MPEIARMARNPVMLTALAVVHWNEHRLPEQRAELYDSVITWLSRSREQRAGRLRAERCVELLQELALAMQRAAGGRQAQVTRGRGVSRGGGAGQRHRRRPRWAAAGTPWILFYFSDEPVPRDRLAQAQRVERLRKELERKGLCGTYRGVRDGEKPFVHAVDRHLRKLVEQTARPVSASAATRKRDGATAPTLTVPAEYRVWLKAQCSMLDLEGLKPKQGMALPPRRSENRLPG